MESLLPGPSQKQVHGPTFVYQDGRGPHQEGQQELFRKDAAVTTASHKQSFCKGSCLAAVCLALDCQQTYCQFLWPRIAISDILCDPPSHLWRLPPVPAALNPLTVYNGTRVLSSCPAISESISLVVM